MKSIHIDTSRTWRGGQNQVLLTVTGLAEIGHQATLVAHERGELRKRATEGLRYFGFSPRSEFDVAAAWQLTHLFSDIDPDVIHAHDPMAVSLTAMALQMKNLPRRPLVVASRRVDFHLKRHAFSKWKYARVDVFIAASQFIRTVLIDDGVSDDRIEVVHDGVNIPFLDKQSPVDARAAFWLPAGAPIVGNVAALAPHKGQKHLVAAAARVVRQLPDARFLIIGEGELREPLQKQIKDLGLDRHVVLTGFRPDVPGLMKSLDLFVMSSVTEGLGSAILEAMACGCAVVGSRTGGIPEAVDDGVTGLLVPPRDECALGEAIARLLIDQSLRESMARAGRDLVAREFSVDRLVRGTAIVYEQRLRQAAGKEF